MDDNMNNNPEVGDTVWTVNQMICVEATDPRTGIDCETRLARRDTVKIVSLPDANGGENCYTCETQGGLHILMTRDEFETVDDPRAVAVRPPGRTRPGRATYSPNPDDLVEYPERFDGMS